MKRYLLQFLKELSILDVDVLLLKDLDVIKYDDCLFGLFELDVFPFGAVGKLDGRVRLLHRLGFQIFSNLMTRLIITKINKPNLFAF